MLVKDPLPGGSTGLCDTRSQVVSELAMWRFGCVEGLALGQCPESMGHLTAHGHESPVLGEERSARRTGLIAA